MQMKVSFFSDQRKKCLLSEKHLQDQHLVSKTHFFQELNTNFLIDTLSCKNHVHKSWFARNHDL